MNRFFILFLLLPLNQPAQPIFLDQSAQAGIDHTGSNRGVAFGDYNNDGIEDIYVSRVIGENLLYRGIGNARYEEVGASAGVNSAGGSVASAWGDIDNDGDLDLYVGNRDIPNILYRNNGNGTFTDISESAGVNSIHRTRAVLFGDVDRDGFIDIYVANISATNYLYHNNGDGTFTNVVQAANAQDFGVAMGSVFFDYDNDGDLDLYLTHDANQPNILYRNNGDGTFVDVSSFTGTNIAAQGMGVDFADINLDGHFDLYITNLYSNELLLNNGDGTFSRITESAGVGDFGMGWGTVFLDANNDGYPDIYMVNDSYFAPFDNIMYRNLGNNTFENISSGTPLESPYGGYGTATSDLNDDGRPDLFVCNSGNDGNQLFINFIQNDHNFVKVILEGKASNKAAIGARVTVEAGGKIFMDEVCAGASYASHNSFILHFGLGNATMIDRLAVRWPNGLEEVYEQQSPNTTYKIVEGESMVSFNPSAATEDISLRLSPNPAGEQLNIDFQLDQPAAVHCRLSGADGRLVYEQQLGRLSSGVHTHTIPLQQLPAGLYYCLIQVDGRSFARRFVKQ